MASRFWADYTWPEIAAMDRARLVAVLPIAATEQHGPHLPLSVDTTIVDGIIARAIPQIPADLSALILPTLAIGKSNEHDRFPGTLSFTATTLMRVWMDIIDSVVRAGVKKFVFFNSHGGQMNLMDVVTRDARAKHNIIIVASNWYALGLPPDLIAADELKHGMHAGEVETAMMRALAPSRVQMAKARNFASRTQEFARDYQFVSISNSGKLGWQTQDLNAFGAAGNAEKATVETGERIIDFVARRFVTLLQEVDRLPLSVLRDGPTLPE